MDGGRLKEYKVCISGGMDCVIVFPQMIEALVTKVRDSKEKEFVVNIEDIMTESMSEYLLNVINTNRHFHKKFQFRTIVEDPISKTGLYHILKKQLEDMRMEEGKCFEKIELVEMMSGEHGFEVEGTSLFIWVCKASDSEKVVIKYYFT